MKNINLKAIFMCLIGSVLEWYDFVIYTSLSPFMTEIFFPNQDKFFSIFLTFTIFAIGFIVRPMGGVIFGYIADKYGRHKAFTYSVLLMAFPSLSMMLLPTYNMIGIFSPILLLIMRIFQGLSVGGEYPALVTYLSEIAPSNHRGLVCSYANVSTVFGVFLATVVVALLSQILTKSEILLWGWRIPFIISLLSAFLGFYLRLKLSETSFFENLILNKATRVNPILTSFKENNFAMIKIFIFIICAGVAYYSYNVFTTTYLTINMGMPYFNVLLISMVSSVTLMILIQVAGHISDRIGRRLTLSIGIISLILFSYPLYLLFDFHSLILALVSQIIFSMILALYLGPLPAFIAEQSQTQVRCSSISISYNLSIAFFGGTTPAVNIFLIKYFETNLAPSYYLTVTALLSFLAISKMKEASKQKLT